MCRIHVAIRSSKGTRNPGIELQHILIGSERDKGDSSQPLWRKQGSWATEEAEGKDTVLWNGRDYKSAMGSSIQQNQTELEQARDTFHNCHAASHKQNLLLLTDGGQGGGPRKTEAKGRRQGDLLEKAQRNCVSSRPWLSHSFKPLYPQPRLALAGYELGWEKWRKKSSLTLSLRHFIKWVRLSFK